MDQKQTQKLLNRYPKIFGLATQKQRSKEPFALFLFECGNGWFELIWDLALNIQQHIDSTGCHQVVAVQVKEKFGALRFYIGAADDHIHALIDAAEQQSEFICETCGKPGTNKATYGWFRTECNDCTP